MCIRDSDSTLSNNFGSEKDLYKYNHSSQKIYNTNKSKNKKYFRSIIMSNRLKQELCPSHTLFKIYSEQNLKNVEGKLQRNDISPNNNKILCILTQDCPSFFLLNFGFWFPEIVLNL